MRDRPKAGQPRAAQASSDAQRVLVESLRAAASGEAQAGLRAWLVMLDAAIAALERTAWQVRELVEESISLVRTVQAGLGPFLKQLDQLQGKVRHTPALAKRASSSAWVLTQIVLSYRLFGTRAAFLPRGETAAALEALHGKNAQRFCELCVQHGGAFLKIGQLLSARADLLPRAWIAQLAQLQDAVPAEPWLTVKALTERELGSPLDALFLSFEEEPIAAASIGQVHRAYTRDGRPLAVKVQRPGIQEQVELDMLLLAHFVPALGSLLPPTDYDTIIAEIKQMVRLELDYVHEAQAMSRMQRLFDGGGRVRVPRPEPALSTRRVMTSDYIAGSNIVRVLDRLHARRDQDPAAEQELNGIMGALLEVTVRQVLQAGFFQADPHPGNFLVTDQGELVLLDFGCCKQLDAKYRQGYVDLARAILAGDRPGMARLFHELGFETRSGAPDTLIACGEALLQELGKGARGGASPWPTSREAFAQAAEVLEAMARDPVVRLPSEFVMLGRVFGTLGGLFTHYQPQLDYARQLLPYLMQVGGTSQASPRGDPATEG